MLLTLASPSHPTSSSSPFLPLHHHIQLPQSLPQPMTSAASASPATAFSYHQHQNQQPASAFPNPHCHSRRRPKLSLQITAVAAQPYHATRLSRFTSPNSAMSPTSRNTFVNATMRYNPEEDSPTSSSSSEDEEESTNQNEVSFKEKKRRRRYEAARPKHVSTPMTTTHHPTTTAAGFLPQPQPARRAKIPGTRKVVFVDTPPEVFYRHSDEEEPEKEVVTTMERAIELGRLKQWVREREAQSPGGCAASQEEDKEWVRKLVAMEMADMEDEEQKQQSPKES